MSHSTTIIGETAQPRFVRAFTRLWHRIARGLFDTYQPELHYMRGPGPKWRAKHVEPTA